MRQLIPLGITASLLMFSGCDGVDEEAPKLELLDKREQLIRLSVDLRGMHPTEVELQLYESTSSPDDAYAKFADTWLEDVRFLDRITEIFNQRLLVETGQVYFDTGDMDLLSGIDDRVMAQIIANEPLMMLRYVVANDMSYSHMVTADHSMANPELALYWGLDYPDDAAGQWVPAKYADGRPHAGLLTMSTIWQRYPSMGGNANRHRANAVSKMFLCEDYLSRPIVLNRAAVDQLTTDPENAIAQNTGCQSCHSTLDPIAANFFGFFNYDSEDGIEQTEYRPENEEEWRFYAGKEPGYYGRPTATIPEFAQELAEDSRYSDCAVRTVWEGLTQRRLVDEDWTEVAPHQLVFDASGMNIKELVRSIVQSDEYKARSARDPELNDRLAGVKVASPSQLSEIITGVTGYTWWFDGRDGLKDHDMGLPILAGGIDSLFVTERGYTPSVGLAFVQERLAYAAAWHVAEHDLDPERTDDAALLVYVTVADTPETAPDAFDEQIRYLYLAATGIPLAEDAPEPALLIETWKYLYSVEASPSAAWAGVTSAVLRDPRVLFY